MISMISSSAASQISIITAKAMIILVVCNVIHYRFTRIYQNQAHSTDVISNSTKPIFFHSIHIRKINARQKKRRTLKTLSINLVFVFIKVHLVERDFRNVYLCRPHAFYRWLRFY